MKLDVLGFIQSDDSRCGVASVKSILYYYGIDATEDEIAKRCNHSYELGCTNEDMMIALESYGVKAILVENGTIGQLAYWNRYRVPVIVDFFTPSINPSEGDMPNGHSGIIVDVDKTNVYLLDPENGKVRTILHEEFERVWFDWDTTPTLEADTKMNLRVMIIPIPKHIENFLT